MQQRACLRLSSSFALFPSPSTGLSASRSIIRVVNTRRSQCSLETCLGSKAKKTIVTGDSGVYALAAGEARMEITSKQGAATLPIPLVSTDGLKRWVCRYFYFVMSLLLAAIVAWGFSRTINDNLFHPAVPRPLLLWIHGTAFSAWVAFFIAQSTLVRVHKVSWHRFMGWFGAGLATLMVPLGIVIAIVMARFDTFQLHETGQDAFLSIPFYDMIAFGVLIALAIYWRKR